MNILVGAALALLIHLRPVEIPPGNPDKLTCVASNVQGDVGTPRWWHVHISASYSDGSRWVRLYSIRPDLDRRKATKDCDDWYDALEKLRRR